MKFGSKDNSRGSSYIKGFKDQETTLRFLEEYGDWTTYYEVFDPEKKASFPSPGKDSPEQGDRDASKRKMMNALNVKTGYVDLYKIPSSLFAAIERRVDARGTLLDRDYTIIKTGKGLGTNYEIENGDEAEIDLDQYRAQMKDHEEALTKAFQDFWGYLPSDYGDDGEGSQEPPARRPAPRETPKVTEDRDAAVEAVRARREAAKSARATEVHETPASKAAVASAKDDDRDPPSEPQQSTSEPAEDEEVVLTEEAVRAMSKDELVRLYAQVGMEIADESMSTEQLADALINALSE